MKRKRLSDTTRGGLRIILIGIVWLLLARAVAAQEHHPPLRFTHLTANEGLPGRLVLAIVQDRQGFMWFGTEDGLAKYDGYTFVVYRNDPDDPRSISNSSVNALYEDPEGYLWVGTVNGLNRFDPATETFTQYLPAPDDPQSLSYPRVRAITLDSAGDLWVGTLGGLNRFDRETGQFEQFLHDPQNPASLSHDQVWAVYADSHGLLWVGTSGGLERFDPETGGFVHYRHNPADPRSLSHNVVTSIYEDREGVLWIGTEGGGLHHFDRETGAFTAFQHAPGNPRSLSSNIIRAILEDSAGDFWLATDGGLNHFDRVGGVFTAYRPEPGNPHSLSDVSLLTLCEDRAGALWIGTMASGVDRLDRHAAQFAHYLHNASDAAGLSGNVVNQIYADRQGYIWLALSEGGLNRFDPRAGRFTRYQHDPDDPTSLSLNQLVALYEDAGGALWVGTWGAGLAKLDRATGTFTHYRHHPDDPTSLSGNLILSIVGAEAGGLWIGTWGGGLSRFDPTTETFTRYQHDPHNPASLPDNRVTALYADAADGTLWVGLAGVGMARFDALTGNFTRYAYNAADPDSLSPGSALDIYRDTAGTLWVAMETGLNKFDPQTERFTHYTERDGLPGNYITFILEDTVPAEQGGPYLWIGTNNGLTRFNPRAGEFRAYDHHDGLQGLGFRRLARARSDTGTLYVGGDNGFNVFDPAALTDNPYVPPVVLTDFQLFNRPVPIGGDSPLQQHIRLTRDIILDYDQSVFSLAFAALDYTAPQRNRYAYMMEGVDPDWVYVGSDRRFATYTNLRPGVYTFRVRAANNSGVWNEEGTRLSITIQPPWWQTWAFRLGLGLTLVGVVAGGVYARDRAIRQRNRELEAQVAARTRELRASELLLQETQQLARLGGWALQLPTQQLTWTPEVARIFGLPPDYVPDLEEVLAFYVPEHQPLIRAAVERGAQEGIPWDLELEIVTAQGERRWTRNIGNADMQADQIARLSGSCQDITVLKQAELAVRESEQRFRLAFEYASAGMCLVDVDGHLLQVNQRLGEMFGYTRAEMVGLHVNDLTHPDYIQVSPTFIEKATSGATRHAQFEKLYYHRDGHLIWGQVVSALAYDEHEKPLYFISHVLDITERKLTETRLRESEERFAAVMNSIEAIIYVADMTTHEVLFMNQYSRGLFGAGEGQVCWQVFQAEKDGPCTFCTNPRLLDAEGAPVGIIAWEMQNTVNGRWYHMQDQAIRWTDGRLVRLEVATDITDIKETEQQVLAQQRQLATLEERERIGRELHDDLGQVMGYVNVQAQTALALLAAQQTFQAEAALTQLVQVAQSAQHDVREYILGIRHSGAIADSFADSFADMLRQYLHTLRQRYGLRVTLTMPDAWPAQLLAPDAEVQLLRIVQESLTNVARHADTDTAQLTLAWDAEWVTAVVVDEGTGFVLDAPHSTEPPTEPDTHFGLTIMRERAASVGGSLDVTTTPGAGTRVAARIPRRLNAPSATETELDRDSARALRVLLVDDHPLFLEGLRNMLGARGVQVVGMAHDGRDALALARQLRPAVILMDVNMPGCDGVTATRNILAELPDIKIVMLTVAADDDTLFAALKNGASGYLLKSLDSATLFELLSELMRGETVIAPGLANRVLLELAREVEAVEAPATPEIAPPAADSPLTDRQREVLQLVAQGLTYKEVGQQLFISERTVKYHMGEIMHRLHLKNREQVTLYAQQEGWVDT